MSGNGPPPIQMALKVARTKKYNSKNLECAEEEYKTLKKNTDKLKKDNLSKFEEIKRQTKNITEKSFSPNAIEHFEHLYNVLQAHGKGCGNVWSSFSLLLECYNHVNKVDHRTKELKRVQSANNKKITGTPQKVGQQKSSNHGGPPQGYTDGEQRKGPGKNEEQIRTLNGELEHFRSVTAEQTRQLEEKERMIQDLTTRLSRVASQQLTHRNPNIADLSDVNRPTRIGERFGQVYDDQWSEAFEALRERGKQDNEIVVELANTVQDIYNFMQDCVEELLHKLASKTAEVIKNPFQTSPGQEIQLAGIDEAMRDLVKTHGQHTLEAVKQKSMEKYCAREQDQRIRHYVDILSELIWYMLIQDPPMVLRFAGRGEKVDTAIYKHYTKSGSIVAVCVWPALYLHKDGPLVARGFVLPQ